MLKRYFRNRRNKKLSARAVFSEVYAQKKWGDKGKPFFSGPDSFDEFAIPYARVVADFLRREYPAGATLVDLGCGDFRVGEKLTRELPELLYHGVDVVPGLVAHHQAEYANEQLRFHCLDLAKDKLPKGQVATIRQVLQHLSNDQIQAICDKFSQFQAIFITEHFPAMLKQPNLDIVHGANTRRKQHSAVMLDQPPFSLLHIEEVLRVAHKTPGEYLVTYLYRPG